MKILREYVWDSLKRNKRTSLAIMTALFLMTTLMTCFCGFIYTMWTDNIALTINETGNWHGELFDDTKGSHLEDIKNYASVSAVMIKGPWEVAKVDDAGKRNYIITRGANTEYWNSMSEKELVIEGRLPENENELVISKQFFDDHPEVSLGDTLTLPVGQRICEGKVCQETAAFHENEDFHQTGTKTYVLAGSMDITTSSSVPAYTAMSFLDEKKIRPEDNLTIYLRFDPMRSTYKELPALAESIGYEKDEYGKYALRYNTDLLSKYAILPPGQLQGIKSISFLSVPLMFLIMAALLIGVFVLVIHNAFALSANEKLSQLGTLAGIGASPKQIRSAVSTEALILLLPPLPLGILCGWLLDTKLIDLINASNNIDRATSDVVMTFGLPAILPAVLLSVITAWLSARIPAKKAAKMMPVEALRQTETLKGKKIRRSRISGRFGISGELAANALRARKKSYRTATISLSLSFLLLTGFLYIMTAQDAAREVYRAQDEAKGHITLWIGDGREPEQKALDELKAVPNIASYVFYNKMPCATWITDNQSSDDIESHLGGFDKIVTEKKYTPIKQDGKYRIYSALIGLERDSFLEYCKKMGIDPQPYLSDHTRALFYNKTADPYASTRRKQVYREILKLKEGQVIPFTERAYNEDTGDFEFDLTVGRIVDELPVEILNSLPRFTLTAIMPMEHVLELSKSCSDKRRVNASAIHGVFMVNSTGELSYPKVEETSGRIDEILERYYGSGDYLLTDVAEDEQMQKNTNKVMNTVVLFLTGLLGLIGISNIWASISGNLRQRSREFAMLKSAGLSPAQLWRMLFLEGLNLGLKPLLYSIPFQIAVLWAFLSINEVTLAEYLPFAPYGILIGYTTLVLLTIIGAYLMGGIRIQRQNIIEAIKDDTI